MKKAFGLAAFVLALLSPFVEFIYVGALGMALFAALIIWIWARYREPEIDEARLQTELSEYVYYLNRERGK